MKVTCKKEYENLESFDISNLMEVYDWLFINHHRNGMNATKEALIRNHRLFGWNKKKFLNLWGKQDFCWIGSSEGRRFYVWSKEFDNCQVVILTHGIKGTCYEYEITGDTTDAQQEIIGFLRELGKVEGDNDVGLEDL